MATTLAGMFPQNTINITAEFVEAYLAEAGFNPADFNTGYLTRIWQEASERGLNFNAEYNIIRDSILADDDDVFVQALNTFDWPDAHTVYEKYFA